MTVVVGVAKLLDAWLALDPRHFTDTYLVRHHERSNSWPLTMFRLRALPDHERNVTVASLRQQVDRRADMAQSKVHVAPRVTRPQSPCSRSAAAEHLDQCRESGGCRRFE